MSPTNIEWTDETWNPTTGCTKVSPACANCYIERTPPFRIKGRKFVKGHIPLELHEDRLVTPLSWRKPRRVFVNSLSDIFHEDVPFEFIDKVFAVMAIASQHTFQILTKRAERMRAYMEDLHDDPDRVDDAAGEFGACHHANLDPLGRWPLPNVWLGISVENQHFADERIPLLLQTPAAIRFISAEPLLGPVNLVPYVDGPCPGCGTTCAANKSEGGGNYAACCPDCRHRSIDWVIVGGESGPGFRYTRLEWVQAIRDQCVAAGVPFFFKQHGGRFPKSGGRLLDGREWNEFPDAKR